METLKVSTKSCGFELMEIHMHEECMKMKYSLTKLLNPIEIEEVFVQKYATKKHLMVNLDC